MVPWIARPCASWCMPMPTPKVAWRPSFTPWCNCRWTSRYSKRCTLAAAAWCLTFPCWWRLVAGAVKWIGCWCLTACLQRRSIASWSEAPCRATRGEKSWRLRLADCSACKRPTSCFSIKASAWSNCAAKCFKLQGTSGYDSPTIKSLSVILYEYPFNERIRTYLRLEHLFQRLDKLLPREDALDHHFALATIFEVMDVAARADLKSDVLRDLEKQKQLLGSY